MEFNSSSTDVLNPTMVVTITTYEMQSMFVVMFDYLDMLQARCT